MTRDEMIARLRRYQPTLSEWFDRSGDETVEAAMEPTQEGEYVRLSEVLAALRAPAVTGEADIVTAFVERCEEIRNGSPNQFYAHVDKFCKAWRAAAPPAAGAPPALVALVQDLAERLNVMIRHRHEEAHNGDIYRGGSYEACPLCAETRAVIGRASAWSPAPAPAAPPAETPVPEDGCTVQFEDMKPWPAPPADAVARVRAIAKESARLLDETADRFISMGEAFAPPAVAGGDAQLAPGEMPPSSTWGDLGRAAKCSRCDDDGQPCSHCEREGQ